MAVHTHIHLDPALRNARASLGWLPRALVRAAERLAAASDARHRLGIAERLKAKSDSELAALGIRREDIVRRVFIDRFDF